MIKIEVRRNAVAALPEQAVGTIPIIAVKNVLELLADIGLVIAISVNIAQDRLIGTRGIVVNPLFRFCYAICGWDRSSTDRIGQNSDICETAAFVLIVEIPEPGSLLYAVRSPK